jgi:hypothetical protein
MTEKEAPGVSTDRLALAHEAKRRVDEYVDAWIAKNTGPAWAERIGTTKSAVVAAIDRLAAALPQPPALDEAAIQRMTERGAKAWADVPNATEWVEEMRGNQAVASLPASPEPPPGSDVHLAVQKGDVSGAPAS